MFEERYYRINKIFLKMLGLWPYQQSYFVRIQKILFISTLVIFIIAQLLVLVTTDVNLFKILSFVFPTIYVTIKYCTFVIQSGSVKQILEHIRNDWNLLKDELEIDIIKEYACNAKFITIFLLTFCYCGIIFIGILQFLPIILDIISPLNESRPFRLIVITEYFINQEKYFYALLMHEILVGFIGTITFCCTGSTIMMYILHACALVKIACYRIENAIEENTLTIPNPRREYFLYKRIVHAVVIHQRAIAFTEFLTSSFAISYFILIIIGVTSLSLNLFRFFQELTLMNNTSEIFIYGILLLIQINYMYMLNYGGQEITDQGIKLFKAMYNGLWYIAPLRTQKLLLFIMQKGMKNITITCGCIFVVSLEGFASLTSTAVSYFTVIYSMR